MSRCKKLLLFIILLLALGIRLYSINYGLPFVVGPDEKRQVFDALSMGARHSLVPLEYTYPAMHKCLLLLLFSIYFSAGYIFRIFSGIPDFIFKFLIDPGSIFLLGRLLSIFFGVALAIPVYLMGRNLFSENIGIIACILAMFMFNLVAHSQWVVSDILLTFWSTWAFYYILRCMLTESTKDFIFTGMFIGLAIATKYQGLYLIIPFLTMLIINIKTFILKKRIAQKIFLSLFIMAVFGSLGNLGFIFNFRESIQRFIELRDEKMGISSLQPFSHNFFSVAIWFVKEIIIQEKTLGAVLILGVLYSIYNHSRVDLIFLAYLFICLFSLVGFGFRFLHLLVYSFAVLCVFAARFIERFNQIIFKKRYRFSYSLIVASIVVISPINNAIQADIKRLNPDTRILAKKWIEKNIPTSSKIAQDWYDFSVPLQGEIPWLFQDEKIKQYYMRYFSEDIRQRYRDYATAKGIYDLTQIRYESEEPIWPLDMPGEAIARAEKIPLVKRLYCWFNFYTLEDLKRMGISYVIISSYSYNHFLLDDDPNKKTGLYNPHILEDTLGSNRQAKTYNKDSRYGLLFFLAKRARDFYLPLLNLERQNRHIKLVKEIYPDSQHLGPVIKIYKLES